MVAIGGAEKGLDKQTKKKREKVWGLYYDNPPMSDSDKMGDKEDKMPSSPVNKGLSDIGK